MAWNVRIVEMKNKDVKKKKKKTEFMWFDKCAYVHRTKQLVLPCQKKDRGTT
jgi:hypothetical protein